MGIDDSGGVTALVGLDGFVVCAQVHDGEQWWLAVETTVDVVGCEACGTRAVGHGRRVVKVRDLAIAGEPVTLVWAKRIWRCAELDCVVKTWSEPSEEIAPRAVLSERARAEIARRVGLGEESVAAAAARAFGVAWPTAMDAVRDHGKPRIDHLSRLGAPTAIGLDETSWLAATATHPTLLVTGIVDLDRGQLVDVIGARSASAVEAWLAAKPTRCAEQIRHAVIDPYQPYANALANEVPDAKLVVDHFHIIGLANAAVDEVRRRVQHDTLRHRGRKGDPGVSDPPAAVGRPREAHTRRLRPGSRLAQPRQPRRRSRHRLSGQGTTPSRLRRRHRVRCPPMARRVLRDLRHRRGRRAHPASALAMNLRRGARPPVGGCGLF